MAICKDDITKHLEDFKYNTIYPPRTDASPLEVLAKKKGELISWGHIDDVLETAEALPGIWEDPNPMDIEGSIASKHDHKAGITILGRLISAAAGNMGLKAVYKNARSMTFRYQNVTRLYVKPVDLDNYMSKGRPDEELLTTIELLKDDKLFVFTAVIKARKVIVEAENNDGGSLSVDLPVVKEIVGANIKVSSENQDNTKIVYEGKIPVGFGFKAVQIDHDDGKLKMRPVDAGSVVASAVLANATDEPDRDYEVYVFEEDYVRLP